VNDINTLNGALQELGETMADNLVAKGVTASASDGLTTLAGKILDIQTGGSCYHIEFSEASYTAVGGSATLEIYLQENYAPKSGASVTVTGSDGSVYNGITNSQGIASVTVSNISTATTFTASYSNVSDTCSVTYATYLFYDKCNSSSGLSEYGSSVLVRGSNATITMTYDSTENAYKLSGMGNYHAMIPIPALNDKDEYKITAEFKGQNQKFNVIGFFLDNRSDTTSYGLDYALDVYDKYLHSRLYRVSSDGSEESTTISSLSGNTWYKLEYIVDGSTLTGTMYNMSNNQLATKTRTRSISNKQMGLFLFCEGGATNSIGYVRNIKAESL
jgi:hypothetical protein